MLKKSIFLMLFLAGISLMSAEQEGQKKKRSFVYSIFDGAGKIADVFLTRGNLNAENQRLFEEVARSLDIDYRGIQAKNMGLFIRLVGGYANAFALQQVNRVYINEDWFNELSEEQKRFLVAHELAHHHNHHIWKRAFVAGYLESLAIAAHMAHGRCDDSIVKKYFVRPQVPDAVFKHFNIYSLLNAQLCQCQETEADTHAVTIAGLDPQSGVALMEALYHPDAKNWPLYGKVHAALNSVLLPIMSLPFLKQHVPHLASFDERVAHLKSLRAAWLEKQKNKEQVAIAA